MSNLLKEFVIIFLSGNFEFFAIISIYFIWGNKDPVDLLFTAYIEVLSGLASFMIVEETSFFLLTIIFLFYANKVEAEFINFLL